MSSSLLFNRTSKLHAPTVNLCFAKKMLFSSTSMPIPLAARSKLWACSRLLAGIVGSNPAGGMDVYLLCVLGVSR